MKTIVIILSLFLAEKMMARQENYEQAVISTLQLWQEGKYKEASSQFKNIAAANKDNEVRITQEK